MRRFMCALIGIAIFNTAMAQIQDKPKASSFDIEESRVFIEGKNRQRFWNITNKSIQSFFYIVEVVDVDNRLNVTKKSEHFLATPPSGIINPEEAKSLRIVRIKDDLSEKTETFALLRLKLIPSFKSDKKNARVQSMMTIFTKLFYRPEKLVMPNAIENAVATLKYHKDKDQLIINNPSPYWLTLSSVKVNGISLTTENNKAWMVGPGDNLSIPYKGIPNNVSVRLIKENGIPTMDRVISKGDMI